MTRRPTFQDRALEWGKLRDATLFTATCIYVLGYLVWCSYAWDRGLGLLPPLQGQYFTAGLVPTALCMLGFAGVAAIVTAQTEQERARAKRLGERWISFAITLILASILAGMPLPKNGSISEALLLTSQIPVLIASYYGVKAGDTFATGVRIVLRIMIVLLVLSLALVYSTRLFPLLPTEFGGAHPQCVRLDLATGELSSELAATLLQGQSATIPSVGRSRPVWLHFEGAPYIWLSVSNSRPLKGATRVRQDLVRGITTDSSCQSS